MSDERKKTKWNTEQYQNVAAVVAALSAARNINAEREKNHRIHKVKRGSCRSDARSPSPDYYKCIIRLQCVVSTKVLPIYICGARCTGIDEWTDDRGRTLDAAGSVL